MVTGMDRDQAITDKLAMALEHLSDAEVMMHQGVSADAWPQVGRLLSLISQCLKQIEFTVTGIGS